MNRKLLKVIESGSCCGCGACIALDNSSNSKMIDTPFGPLPKFGSDSSIPEYIKDACPCVGVNYPDLYKEVYGKLPDNWLTGEIKKVRTGYSNQSDVRKNAASGGVITQTLIYLLENRLVDAVIVAKQGIPSADKARAVIARTKEEIVECSQSIYIPVSMLDILRNLDPEEKYAITCLPEQSASLRVLQKKKFGPALQIKYLLGPYTGTALYPEAIRCYLRSKNIKDNDQITSLKWREGDWPGCLEIRTASGRILRTPKVYYNYLIPFFITQTSLQSMDFVNEFADLSVGDAWSPAFEVEGGGHSVVVTRSNHMEKIISEMIKNKLLILKEEDPIKASDMHGHMLDFKKRGGYLRNKWRKILGKHSPNYGYRPSQIYPSRIIAEIIISLIFAIGKTKTARWIVSRLPESFIGPIFNNLRLAWKNASRPTKRKGLASYRVILD
tara:strand:+ start:7120 stop:8445 length:1326 start_codon:yes stop_codon:yes gene_type:complete